jgi:hypothetical protein
MITYWATYNSDKMLLKNFEPFEWINLDASLNLNDAWRLSRIIINTNQYGNYIGGITIYYTNIVAGTVI